ncbi:MAG: glycosyltransferase, partial [Balneolaceae bacterium]
TPAIEHLEISEPVNSDCTIHIWDSQSTGIDMIPPPCEKNHFTDRGDIWGFTSKRIKTAFHWSEFSVNVMDMDTNKAVYWVRLPAQLPYWVYSSPLRTIFHWWMEKNGGQLLHAAAVGTDEGAVLITGKGGVGKSTTALACLNAGMNYLADDYLIVKNDPSPTVFSLYNTGKLNRGEKIKFSQLRKFAGPVIQEDQEKDVLFFYPELKNQLLKSSPVRAILEPEVKHKQNTTFKNISYWRIQRALSFTTMSQLPGVGAHTHDFINKFCGSVPSYRLEPGTDIDKLPAAISEFIRDPESFITKAEPVPVNTNMPLISVIIPVYNGEKFIESAIENILTQNYPALEIIIVNDGSTDNTEDIINTLPVDVRYFRQENMGPSNARNWGIKDASGEFIAFLDVDDLWPENNLELLLSELVNDPEHAIVRGRAQLFKIDEDGGKEYVGDPKESYLYYIGAGLYRKSVFEKVGLFDPNLLYGEDTDWYNRAKEMKIPIKWLNEITLFVQRHGKNMTEGKNILELNQLKTFKKILDRDRNRDYQNRLLKREIR